MNKILCTKCGELIGHNKKGTIPQSEMFCKNRPHRLHDSKRGKDGS